MTRHQSYGRLLIVPFLIGITFSNVTISNVTVADEKAKTKTPQAITAEGRELFENKIRPVLVKQCYSCHSATSKEIGGKLLLDTRAGLLKGGESGPTLLPRRPEESLLIQALRYESVEMPPEEPLTENVINDFVHWVKIGAPDPRTDPKTDQAKPALEKPSEETVADESLWAFQPINHPAIPEVKNEIWSRDPLDQFILSRIEEAGLSPTGDAPSATLIRRLSFDLTGLPPTYEQVMAFQKACEVDRQQAVETLVDQLLASPHFGERWGRHWLDVARFAESNGNDGLGRNATFPHAWRYRDYVIESINNDVPYNRFLQEQIAGDLLPAKTAEERDRLLIATGFLAVGSKPAKAMNTNFEMDVVKDQIHVVSTAVMGLSVACARCHDHKHDPIPTRDYYAMAGLFTSSETLYGMAANERLTAPMTPLHQLKAAPQMDPPTEPPPKVVIISTQPKPKTKNPYKPGTPLAMGVRDRAKPVDCKVNIRGESKQLGPLVPRGFLSASKIEGATFPINPKQSGRLELAQWLTHPEHPQTSRVFVNRVWLKLFGQGLVRTPDDFGVYGARPTHPELLDHLARRLQDGGWSLKKMIRAIVLSRTYQLDSMADSHSIQTDPNNDLYARHSRRRLDAEALRDSMMQASGELDFSPGVGSDIQHWDVLINLVENLHKPSKHRSIYLCRLRNSPPKSLMAFDLPNAIDVKGQRDETTLPTQALFLLNSPFVVEQSVALAEKLLEMDASENQERIRAGYQRVLAREPSETELAGSWKLIQTADSYLKNSLPDSAERERTAWATFCQALLATNEFRYVD